MINDVNLSMQGATRTVPCFGEEIDAFAAEIMFMQTCLVDGSYEIFPQVAKSISKKDATFSEDLKSNALLFLRSLSEKIER